MKCSMLKYKWMYIAVFCCAMFAACEQTSNVPDENAPISFGTGRTHASGEYNAKLWGYTIGTNGYWVFAGTTTDGLTDGENARYDAADESLTPAVTRYWADNQTYNFYSIWPIVPQSTVSSVKFNKSNSQLSFSYGSIERQLDLCLAAAINEQGGADRNTPVQMTYKHALSKVQFYGFSSTAGITAQLTNFTITVPKSATAVCTLTEDTEERTTDENNVTTEYPLDITYTLASETSSLSSTGEFALQDETTNPNGTQVLEKLVLPMQGGTFHVAATYKIGNNTKTVETNITATWQPGKNYIYKFKIQPAGPIVFADEVIINDWDEEIPAGDVQF